MWVCVFDTRKYVSGDVTGARSLEKNYKDLKIYHICIGEPSKAFEGEGEWKDLCCQRWLRWQGRAGQEGECDSGCFSNHTGNVDAHNRHHKYGNKLRGTVEEDLMQENNGKYNAMMIKLLAWIDNGDVINWNGE